MKASTLSGLLLMVLAATVHGDQDDGLHRLRGLEKKQSVRMYLVEEGRIPPGKAKQLLKELGLPDDIPQEEDGGLNFLDTEKFQNVPTIELGPGAPDEHGRETVEKKMDFEGIKKIQVIDDAAAVEKANQALTKSGLHPGGLATVEVTHSKLEIIPKGESTPTLSVPLDTQVNYGEKLNGRRLIGPGAKMKVVFNDKGETTQLTYNARKLKTGPKVEIDPPAVVEERYRRGIGRTTKADILDISCGELAYYAPPLGQEVGAIYPHYVCEGKTGTGEETAELHQTMLPAIADLPVVGIDLETVVEDKAVKATAVVTGGVPPFSYEWSSDATPLEGVVTTDSTLSYDHSSRSGDCQDRLHLTVTDARGLRTAESVEFEVTGCDRRRLEAAVPVGSGHRKASISVVDAGVEYINESGGLSNSKALALGFANCMAFHGTPTAFKWGDYNAWETDWKDPVYSGDDSNWADNVDIALFSGHGNSYGWSFESNHDDHLLRYTDARFGNYDLEWLAVHACQVLAVPSRWENAFHGLHMMLGFKTNTMDHVDDGRGFCNAMHERSIRDGVFLWLFPALKVRHAWDWATRGQPSWVEYRMMGPVRYDGVSNIDDYYWLAGRGSVGPDIQASQISDFWVITGNC